MKDLNATCDELCMLPRNVLYKNKQDSEEVEKWNFNWLNAGCKLFCQFLGG